MVKSIELLPDSRRKKELLAWLQYLENDLSSSILGIDLETVRIWGTLTADAQKAGRILPVSDGIIAATAIQHGLHLMTRNVSDFVHSGTLIMNPWQHQ